MYTLCVRYVDVLYCSVVWLDYSVCTGYYDRESGSLLYGAETWWECVQIRGDVARGGVSNRTKARLWNPQQRTSKLRWNCIIHCSCTTHLTWKRHCHCQCAFSVLRGCCCLALLLLPIISHFTFHIHCIDQVKLVSIPYSLIMPFNPLFESTSPLKPSLLTISFAGDPKASLGAHLHNCDKVQYYIVPVNLTLYIHSFMYDMIWYDMIYVGWHGGHVYSFLCDC